MFETLKTRIGGEGDLAARVEALILGLAEEVKATSNDQNVQRLSRNLRAAAADLTGIVTVVERV